MLPVQPKIQRIQTCCALCISRCGAVAVLEDGRFVSLEPDPSHPTGKALCAKGRAAAGERGILPGDWVTVETPEGSVRARLRLNPSLDPGVACGQHGWWQACPEAGAPGYDPFSPEGANYNLLISNDRIDPVSGSVPHRAYLWQIRRLD